ncbi:hypothetical protein [Acinetobacter sp. Marseille-Q1623]|uniref:hypothetical protein n=1 Tax=Acinetobacter sp. Marseille-Q1623 TaxID=2697501 RepID=UPI00157B056A|nr:hypothetical protein [Acinetobacter sp. Marseille-Q1623]
MGNDKQTQLSEYVYRVYLDWFSVAKGGRKQIPLEGLYYCTTELKQEQRVSSWSIVLKLGEYSQEALLWFLVDAQQRVAIGDVIDLMEGSRCVGQAIVYLVELQNMLNFWFETCQICDGQGRLVLYMDEKYHRPILCCDECDLVVNLHNQEKLHIRQVKLGHITLADIGKYKLEQYARHIYKK